MIDLQSAAVELLREEDRQLEAEIRRRLGAPIFARLMVEHGMNPLGLTILRPSPRLDSDDPWRWAGRFSPEMEMQLILRSRHSIIFERPVPHGV